MAKRTIDHIVNEKPVLDDSIKDTQESFNKHIRNIPNKLKDDFDNLKRKGVIYGSLNSYIIYSLSQQLSKDKDR